MTVRLVAQRAVPIKARFSPRPPPRIPNSKEPTPHTKPAEAKIKPNGYHQKTIELKKPRLIEATAIPRIGAEV